MRIGFAWLTHRYIDVCAVRKITIHAFCQSRTQSNEGCTTSPKNMQTFQSYCKSKANKAESCTCARKIPGGMTSKAAHGKATKTDTSTQPKTECISRNKEQLQTINKHQHTACCQSQHGNYSSCYFYDAKRKGRRVKVKYNQHPRQHMHTKHLDASRTIAQPLTATLQFKITAHSIWQSCAALLRKCTHAQSKIEFKWQNKRNGCCAAHDSKVRASHCC